MFSHFFIQRPIFASVLSIVITLAGAVAAITLPVAQYPQITPPSIMVQCTYPGADARVVAESVAAPIEQQVNGVEDMLYMVSQSNNDGSYTLTVTFKPGVNLNFAQVLVQNRINLALPLLPDVVKQAGVTTRKRNPDILLVLGVFSPNGRADGEGRQVRVKDIGHVELGARSLDSTSKLDGLPNASLAVWALPDANSIATADRVVARMEQLKKSFPEDIDYVVSLDMTPFMKESIHEVFRTLIEAVILVAIVVLIFLQNWRSAIIPLAAVPVAIVGTFSVMAAIGFRLNNLSMLGLVLAIGIVVDDAIVVVEAVEHHLEEGMSPRGAAHKAMEE